VIDNTAELGYYSEINDNDIEDTAAEPVYLTAIDNAAEPDHLAAIKDTAEPDYHAVLVDAGAPVPEYTAATDGAANNPAFHETVENAYESTHTDVCKVFLTLI
jgi:hypothetical protein